MTQPAKPLPPNKEALVGRNSDGEIIVDLRPLSRPCTCGHFHGNGQACHAWIGTHDDYAAEAWCQCLGFQ